MPRCGARGGRTRTPGSSSPAAASRSIRRRSLPWTPRRTSSGTTARSALLDELAALLPAGTDAPGVLAGPMPTVAGVEPVGASLAGVADDRAAVERTRAFVKVQDGCSFFCTYCIIPRARGPERSLAPELVLQDVRRAVAAGHREVVLTGINVGTYDGGWSDEATAARTPAPR